MQYQLIDQNNKLLDAHFSIEGGEIVFHSRSGTKGSPTQRNSDYAAGLRLLLNRLNDSSLEIEGIWVDSSVAKKLSVSSRSVFGPSDEQSDPDSLFTAISTRMKNVGRSANAKPGGGNSTKRLRIALRQTIVEGDLETLLGVVRSEKDFRSEERLPAEVLRQVRADNVWRAVQKLMDGEKETAFGPSTFFDLIADASGKRLPPKAVFGLAATEALGFEVLPQHFDGGTRSVCFEILESAGYRIVRKADGPEPQPFLQEKQSWAEGGKRYVTHMKSERATGLSSAKKDAFRSEHGRLFCELCHLEPEKEYGTEHGNACIEVHHAVVQVSDMPPDHISQLTELQCLCANCHRIVHSELRAAEKARVTAQH